MVWIHPVLISLITVLAIYVTWLGVLRTCSLHFKRKIPFLWKRHVRLGTIVLFIWAVGAFLGLGGAYYAWNGTFIGELHAQVGLIMVPLAIIGYLTGAQLDKVKKRRKWLPIIHGVNNVLLLGLSFWQVYTGIELFEII